MIKSIVREHHWHPDQIGRMYLDDTDLFGLEYWYNDVKEVAESIKPKK